MTRSLMLLGLVGSIVFTLTAVAPADARTATSTVTVEATGEAALQGDAAAARAEAIWSAKRNAVEEAGGLLLRAVTDASHYRIVRQETSATVQGFIRSWSLVPGSVTVKQLEPPLQGQVICVQIEAVVDIQPLAHSMAELQDVYNDLNRPSLWVDVKSTSQSATAARTDVDVNLTSWLKSNGFNIAAHEHDAAVVLHVELLPVWKIRMGGSNTPYDLGAQVSSCSLDLTWQALETSSQMVLESGAQHEQATSFSSNAAAASKASRRAVTKLEANPYIITTLLARWTAERYSGYVASIQAALDHGGAIFPLADLQGNVQRQPFMVIEPHITQGLQDLLRGHQVEIRRLLQLGFQRRVQCIVKLRIAGRVHKVCHDDRRLGDGGNLRMEMKPIPAKHQQGQTERNASAQCPSGLPDRGRPGSLSAERRRRPALRVRMELRGTAPAGLPRRTPPAVGLGLPILPFQLCNRLLELCG